MVYLVKNRQHVPEHFLFLEHTQLLFSLPDSVFVVHCSDIFLNELSGLYDL